MIYTKIKTFALDFYHDTVEIDLFKHATAMAYVSLLGLIPSLAAFAVFLTHFEAFTGFKTDLIKELQQTLLNNFTAAASEQALRFVNETIGNIEISKIGVSGAVGFLFTLTLLLRQIELCFNQIWGVVKPRNSILRLLYFLFLIIVALILLTLFVGLLTGFNLENFNPFNQESNINYGILAGITPLVGFSIFFTALYKITPNCKVKLKPAIYAGILASFGVMLAASFYGQFIRNFTSYEMIYGAIAAIPIFLFWLYILWLITLFGALMTKKIQELLS